MAVDRHATELDSSDEHHNDIDVMEVEPMEVEPIHDDVQEVTIPQTSVSASSKRTKRHRRHRHRQHNRHHGIAESADHVLGTDLSMDPSQIETVSIEL